MKTAWKKIYLYIYPGCCSGQIIDQFEYFFIELRNYPEMSLNEI